MITTPSLQPVFVDEKTYNIDPKKISSKAIIPVSLYVINQIAKSYS